MYQYLLDNGMTRDGVPLLPGPPAASAGASWATTTTSPTSTWSRPDGHTRAAGEIFGYATITRQYFERYHLPVMHTETNLNDGPSGDESVHWLWKQWANVLRVRNDGVPVVGFTWYSLTDQVDWDIALREQNGRRQPARPLRPDRRIRRVGQRLPQADRRLAGVLPAQSLCLQVPVLMPVEQDCWPPGEGPPTA